MVKVENGEVYAMDSSHNMGMFKDGIQKWTDTTMLDPSLVTDYWYISDITPDEKEQKVEVHKTPYFNTLRYRITCV